MNAPLHVLHSDWQEPNSFDEYDLAHFSSLPLDVAKAVSALLQTRREIEAYKYDDKTTAEALKPDLDKLYTACLQEWRDPA
jgi:hypothetical protein